MGSGEIGNGCTFKNTPTVKEHGQQSNINKTKKKKKKKNLKGYISSIRHDMYALASTSLPPPRRTGAGVKAYIR
ncbi:hypothetical protein POVWA2_048860 [Plasmodium ovale wallikeri]|uniref:Uncharacterized protein n=1 Tax=Plasmodium ovale wallikeri TaxID=864142 RepID=A0A1A8ZM23_PLAOA|nr:hypothetical protein POVWA1_049760 [Plasmodium ovale wallikeri]SBT44921.1 hypothetical protein POVWA2_048860 [Plasmodium ovale wallikeri]